MTSDKTTPGNFFEDFRAGQVLRHATPRTITTGDTALYTALYGSRFAVNCSDEFARTLGHPRAPVDDLLVFHMVFGKTVADISLNAVANLGYADCRFLAPVYPGDTLSSTSRVIGLKETSSGKTGIVYVRTTGTNQHGRTVLDYVRWVMVNKRRADAPAPDPVVPDLPARVDPQNLGAACADISCTNWDTGLAGTEYFYDDYQPGEKIDHVDGVTVEEAEHMLATRLYQNTAKVHFNQHAQQDSRFGRRLIYGGHVISIARALSFNGLAGGFHIAAINAGRHTAPLFAGGTVYAWSHIIEKAEIAGRSDAGALRIKTCATLDHPCSDFPGLKPKAPPGDILLELDYWLLMPRRFCS